MLKVWAGNPSYDSITSRVNAAWTAAGRPPAELARRSTIADCFRTGRRRFNADLVTAIVEALSPDAGYVAQWRQALQVLDGVAQQAAQVRVQDTLPPDLDEFTGRNGELDTLRKALRDGGTVAIAGMAGAGKTRLAVHAGHVAARDRPFDRVLFVNLRGFDPDPAQPPAEPAAVLDGFLRLLGMPGREIPYGLADRVTAYRERLAGTRTLVVLDNAADAEQLRPLLPSDTPGIPVLVTSRRSLSGLGRVTRLTVGVFTPEEALTFLVRAAPGIPVGGDKGAAARIVDRCGLLPLAVGLVAGRVRGRPGWTLTDHADRLDERHRAGRLEPGVSLALDLSYEGLTSARRLLLRLAARHPGHDVDAYAGAALAGAGLAEVQADLDHLYADHLLQQPVPGRYAMHDLVRAHALDRGADEDPPAARRAALTRLFDYQLATASAAAGTLYPAETRRRPAVAPAGTPAPVLHEEDAARTWLDAERENLVASAVHTAAQGWPDHTVRLAQTLFRYLDGGHYSDALTVHAEALRAAEETGDEAAQVEALFIIGATWSLLGRPQPAADHLEQALTRAGKSGDLMGEARALTGLGNLEMRAGRFEAGIALHRRALPLHRRLGDRASEARTLGSLGAVAAQLGDYATAAGRLEQALALFQEEGDRPGENWMLGILGYVDVRLERWALAADHLGQALTLARRDGHRMAEAHALDGLGQLSTRRGEPGDAVEHHEQALAIFREIEDLDGEAMTFNGLGEAVAAAGDPLAARTHHAAALVASGPVERARAHTGLGHAHRALDQPETAQENYRAALTIYTDLGLPDAERIRGHLETDLRTR